MNFKNLIQQKEYDFLRKEKQLSENIILLALGGSHAYGTSNKDSDVDIRGCTKENKKDLIGFSKFNEHKDDATDTVIYGFNKLVKLLIENNPNTIEILGCKPEHYLILKDEGKKLLENKKMFLSQSSVQSFSGYALSQLNRLENALARDRLSQEKKERHILNSLEKGMLTFHSRYAHLNEKDISLYIDDSEKSDLEKEIFIDISTKKYPLRDMSGMLDEMRNTLKQYGKLNHRNNKKDEKSLDKHAMHLIRLFIMGIDILEKEEINTYRENERNELIEIRNGKYRKSDSTYRPEFFEMVEVYKKRMAYAAKNTSLPKKPDMKKIEEFVVEVNKNIILNGGN